VEQEVTVDPRVPGVERPEPERRHVAQNHSRKKMRSRSASNDAGSRYAEPGSVRCIPLGAASSFTRSSIVAVR
jgi:hypothetical protein